MKLKSSYSVLVFLLPVLQTKNEQESGNIDRNAVAKSTLENTGGKYYEPP